MKYSISTGSNDATKTAKILFEEGGNAFDAAVGAVFTSMISEFALTGPGGGGSLIGIKNNNKPIIYDFFVDCPKINNQKIDFSKIDVDFGDTTQSFYIGKGSVAIPGTIAGLLDVQKENGKLPLSVVIEPAIQLAKEGTILTNYQAYINKLIKPILLYTKDGEKLFTKDNNFLSKGDVFKNSAFADFLFCLSKEGKKFFYLGDCANLIEKHFSNEGFITRDCLENYKAYKREPLNLDINNYKILTNPAPAYGGTLITFLLRLLQESSCLDGSLLDIIKGMELTSYARNEISKDLSNEFEIDNILNDKFFNKYLDYFKAPNYPKTLSKLSGFGSTTHVSIMDNQGNAVSVTTTNGEGCGHFIPEMGIMMNNMLGEQDLNPFGFHKWNTVRRLPSMISPMILLKNNKPEIALGTGGSNRIRSALTQVIINLIIKNMPLQQAIEEPRIHFEENSLYFEPGIQIQNHQSIKHLRLNPFTQKHLFFGGVNAVSNNSAIGDLRRGGVGLIN